MMDIVFFAALMIACSGHPWLAVGLLIVTGRIGFSVRSKS